MKRSKLMRRTAMKRTEFKRKPEHKRLRPRGRRSKDRTTKSGRIILTAHHYENLCREVWFRDRGECTIRHRDPVTGKSRCWGRLPEFSTRWCDHKIKRSQGGSDTLENLRLACPPCHDWLDNQGGKIQIRMEIQNGKTDDDSRRTDLLDISRENRKIKVQSSRKIKSGSSETLGNYIFKSLK